MENVEIIFLLALLIALCACGVRLWTIERALHSVAENTPDEKPRYAIVEVIEPGLRVVQDRYTGRRVIVTDRGGAAEI